MYKYSIYIYLPECAHDFFFLRLRQCGKLCPEVVPGTFQSAWMPSATALLCPRLQGSPTWGFSGFSSELPSGYVKIAIENGYL